MGAKYIQAPKPKSGWRHVGWRSTRDLTEDSAKGVPRWLRCIRCNRLVTHGQIATGGCICGERKLTSARILTWWEITLLKLGWFPLNEREIQGVHPLIVLLGWHVRPRLIVTK